MICGLGNSYLKFSHPYKSDDDVHKDADTDVVSASYDIFLSDISDISAWGEQAAACEGWWEL